MKILMIGLGSIGQRHVRNMRRLYGDDVELIAYRVRGLERTLTDSMQVDEGVTPEKRYDIRTFYDLDEALREKPEVAFVTNVTSAHVSSALRALKAGCDVFVEKPLSDRMDGIAALKSLADSAGRIVFVGFQNRFHPALLALKEELEGDAIGELVSADVVMGERVATMHAYEDYRDTYMVRKDQGGGVVLNQQIHELDYIYWLFGKPRSVFSIMGASGCLESDVEEYASSLYVHERKGRCFPVYAHADFFQYPSSRFCRIVGVDGALELDLSLAKLTKINNRGDVKVVSFEGFERNDLFIAELEAFMNVVETRLKPEIGLEDAVASMQMALAAKKSANEKRVVEIDEIEW